MCMQKLKRGFPYIVGVIVGFLTIPTFALGFNAGFGSAPFVGNLLMALALMLWPLLIITAVLLNVFVYKEDSFRRKQWYKTLFLPPVGAVLSLLFLALLYAVIN